MIQNMIRPGSRIEFESVPAPAMTVGGRGTAALALPMSWGAEGELITVLSTELVTGGARAKIGYSAAEKESLLFRECLRYCYRLFVWRSDRGGVKATATEGNLTATALYTGVRGNDLQVAVEGLTGGSFMVRTFVNEELVAEQETLTVEDLVNNDWVEFSGTGAPTAVAGLPLRGGADGTINRPSYDAYHKALSRENWQAMGIVDESPAVADLVAMFIKNQRDTQGRKLQGVVYNSVAANHEGIIGIKQGYALESGAVLEGADAIPMAVGMSAGAAINASNTNRLVTSAARIIGELEHDEIEKALLEGWFVISKRTDGTIKIEQDINTFRDFKPTKGKEYRKNRVIRTLDEINNTVKATWESFYEGRADNNRAGRNSFKADLIAYFRSLEALSCIEDFEPGSDLLVQRGTEIDAVWVEAWIRPIDSMEKLYMKVYTDVNVREEG